jgi:hypothetical protein
LALAPESAVFVSLAALVLGSMALGGGVYETLLVDPAWPNNLGLIQPRRGGLNRKIFWGLIHPLFELALIISAWSTWNNASVRVWIILTLAAHFTARLWSFAYFIPQALRFEKLDELTPEDRLAAIRWTRLSRCRPLLEAVSIASLAVVIQHLMGAVPPG